MIGFKTSIQKFDQQGEKTGWSYICIENKIAEKLKPGNKKSFRVKGKIDNYKINSVALLPMGEGNFIMPVNAVMRKAIKKIKGAIVIVELEEDITPVKLSPALLSCLKDEPDAKKYFEEMPLSHKHYYSNWIQAAKTETTKAKRIASAIYAFSNKLTYAQMMKLYKRDNIYSSTSA